IGACWGMGGVGGNEGVGRWGQGKGRILSGRQEVLTGIGSKRCALRSIGQPIPLNRSSTSLCRNRQRRWVPCNESLLGEVCSSMARITVLFGILPKAGC